MNELALFAGAGGGILGGVLLGWRTVCAVELDPYAASVLIQRQNDGLLPPFPVWDDVRTFDGKPWRGLIDVVSGGFPCQDISAAGKGAGIDGDRSGLWREMARIIGEVRPEYVFVENSPLLVGRGLARVLGDLAAMGFNARWGIVGAHHVGSPHKRDRCWIVAHAHVEYRGAGTGRENGKEIGNYGENVADPSRILEGREDQRPEWERTGKGCEYGDAPDTDETGPQGRSGLEQQAEERATTEKIGHDPVRRGENEWWLSEPDVGRVAHGVAARVDRLRLRSLGNAVVPQIVEILGRAVMDVESQAVLRER